MQIEDLNNKSLQELSTEEGIEMLRQIRLSRRIPVKKRTQSPPKQKPLSMKGIKQSVDSMTKDQSLDLLKMLEKEAVK